MSLLEDMRTCLDERGWTKGIYSNTAGEVCLLGAAQKAAHSSETRWLLALPELRKLAEVIMENYADRTHVPVEPYEPCMVEYWAVTTFNDHADTVYADVVVVLEKAQASV